MNLAGGQKRLEELELVNITVASISDEAIQKSVHVYAINNSNIQRISMIYWLINQ